MNNDLKKRVSALAGKFGVLRTRDFDHAGIPRRALPELVIDGVLTRTTRGLYASTKGPFSAHHSLAEVAKRTPKSTICLLSALRFHELTTENPDEVWIALPPNARTPKLEYPPVRSFRFSGSALTSGAETHVIEGVTVRIYSAAKTVADCFKFRNQIGTNVAVEALRDAWRMKKATADELWHFAKDCRVLNVMKPYFESIIE